MRVERVLALFGICVLWEGAFSFMWSDPFDWHVVGLVFAFVGLSEWVRVVMGGGDDR